MLTLTHGRETGPEEAAEIEPRLSSTACYSFVTDQCQSLTLWAMVSPAGATLQTGRVASTGETAARRVPISLTFSWNVVD